MVTIATVQTRWPTASGFGCDDGSCTDLVSSLALMEPGDEDGMNCSELISNLEIFNFQNV